MAEMKNFGKVKPVQLENRDKEASAYEENMAIKQYPGTKGIALPNEGKQQVSGFKFSGTY